MMRPVLLLTIFVAASAQNEATQPELNLEGVQSGGLEQSIFAQVQAEQLLSKQHLSLVLRIQRAQYNSMAASIIYKNYLKSRKSDNIEDSLFSGFPGVGGSFPGTGYPSVQDEEQESQTTGARGDLLSSYYLLSALNLKKYQIILGAADLQEQFFLDRKLSLAIQFAGPEVPQQLVQFVYLKQLSTYLKTLKLSTSLQILSHWRMWLEDEIDVNAHRVTSPGDIAIVLEQKEPLIRDRLFAFSSFQTFAQIDLQIFMLDTFLANSVSSDSSLGSFGSSFGASQAAQAQAASFLEEQTEFLPFLVRNQNPQLYAVLIKYYIVLYQVQAAQAGYTAAVKDFESLKEKDLDVAKEAADQAHKLFHSDFASAFLQINQLEYMDAIFEASSLFAAGAGGSLGGSLGGSFGPAQQQPITEQVAPAAEVAAAEEAAKKH
eukprot:c15794_g1_i2.p1 GENE.c15794_g1_i2~~c15794_g1_i2.p1  ORF type:complete len:443 (+),score=92.86 c15794_g1_i2:35-1330(+)